MNTPTQQQIEDAAKESSEKNSRHKQYINSERAIDLDDHYKGFISGANYYKANSGNDAVEFAEFAIEHLVDNEHFILNDQYQTKITSTSELYTIFQQNKNK